MNLRVSTVPKLSWRTVRRISSKTRTLSEVGVSSTRNELLGGGSRSTANEFRTNRLRKISEVYSFDIDVSDSDIRLSQSLGAEDAVLNLLPALVSKVMGSF